MILAMILAQTLAAGVPDVPAGPEATVAEASSVVGDGAAAPVSDAGGPAADGGADAVPRSVKITSDRTDFDRREGVIMFDRNVFVDEAEYKLHSDQLYVFLDTNSLGRAVHRADGHDAGKGGSRPSQDMLRRIVAIGNVSITNETRVGSCAKAVYTRATSKVVMYGDAEKGLFATLTDNGKNKSQVEGRKITFWIDTEQVEVEGSTVTLDAGAMGGKEGAKKLLKK